MPGAQSSLRRLRKLALRRRASIFFATSFLAKRMDCRVKPGNSNTNGAQVG